MVELKEIRIGDNEVNLKDNLVKSSILPQSSKELSRNIKIQGNVVIEGGVFGNNIDVVQGEVTFQGAVFANNELHINNEMQGIVTFQKAVTCADSIIALITSGRVIFGSDLNAKIVKLKNCYVGGSIYASEVYLENCVVLGGVFGTSQVIIDSSIVGTFHGASVELCGIDYLLYPACFSIEPLTALPKTELYNLSLAHLGALFKGEKESENTGKIRMDFTNDKQRTVLVDDNQSNIIVNSYSVSGRVLAADMLDLNKLENHFLISAGSLGTQILKVYSLNKTDGTKSEELSVPNIANFFFQVLSGKIAVQELSGEISFEELKRSFE